MAETAQSVAFLDYFSELEDPRQAGKVVFALDEIMLLVLCGVLSGAEGFVEIARWGEMHLDFLRRFLPYTWGIPSHDALNDLFNALDHEAFRDSFVAWAQSLRAVDDKAAEPEVVAVDGKTARRSGDKRKGRAALHMVSAWASRQRLVLGQEAVEDKENEILAIPKLLEILELKGALVTIDAMGCHKTIAQTIRDKGADYLLPVKGNQPSLEQDLDLFFGEQRAANFADCQALFHETVDGDHGRLEIRRHWAIADIDWLKQRHDWPGLQSIALIEREVERNGKSQTTRHLYISSLPADAVLLGCSTWSSTTTSAGCETASAPRTSPSSSTSPSTCSSRPRPNTNTALRSLAKWPLGQPTSSKPSFEEHHETFKRFPWPLLRRCQARAARGRFRP
jgi:predicted transposase YbfD/YdcC